MKIRKRLLLSLKSMRFRILAAVLAAGILPAYISIFIFLGTFESRQIDSSVITITGQAQLINNQIISGGYLGENEAVNLDGQLNALDNIYSGRIMVMDTSMKILKDTYGIYDGKTMIWEDAIRSAGGESVSSYDKENHLITVVLPIIANQGKDDEAILGVILITRGTESIEQMMSFYESLAIVLMLLIAFLAVLAAIVISRRMTDPLHRISERIERAGNGMTETIDVGTYSETADISEKFNQFSAHIRRMDRARQEFVSNVSHELKTPLTSMKLLSDSLMSTEDAPVEFYREFMTDIASEIDRETKIIDDLLTLVRMERDTGKLDISSVNINDLIERIMKQLRPIAEAADVELVLETFRPVSAEADEVKFSQAMINLIENAIKYNRPGGWVHVSVNSDHQFCFIRVEDNGIGIPESELDSVFERFYRVDKSHSKEIEGTGLGLSITRNVILLHHGEIGVSSTEGAGTSFAVRLPLTYIAETSYTELTEPQTTK